MRAREGDSHRTNLEGRQDSNPEPKTLLHWPELSVPDPNLWYEHHGRLGWSPDRLTVLKLPLNPSSETEKNTKYFQYQETYGHRPQ